MIKLKSLLTELTQKQKELKKDYLFQQTKMHSSNTVPTWTEVWNMFKTNGDSFKRAIEDLQDDFENDEAGMMEHLEDIQRDKYFELVQEYKHLDGEKCWRTITIPATVDPVSISQLGVYWAIEESAAEAHWGHMKGHHKEITYDGIIDLHNVDWYGTMFARMDYVIGDDEKEIRFLKNSRIFVPRCHSSLHGRVDRHIINDYRRT